MDRKTILFQGIDVSKSVGLEIGPACYPTVNKDEGEIYYLDYLSRDDLLSKYKADSSMRLSDMVEVDFVCPDGRISECVGSMRFDCVVASHVIEHVADVVGFLQDIERILLPEGVIALAIPDKRFTMDRFRRETSLADLIANHSIRANRPTPFQVIDHFSGVRKVDLAAAWDSELLIEDCPRLHTDQESLIHLKSSIEKGVWHDVHASVFTPTSLISLISDLNRLDFIRLSVRYMAPTPRLQLEFFLQLS